MVNFESFFMFFFFLVCILFFLINRKKVIVSNSLKKIQINKSEVKVVTLYAIRGDYNSSFEFSDVIHNSAHIHRESFDTSEAIEYLIRVCSEYASKIKEEDNTSYYINSFNLFRSYIKHKNKFLENFCNKIEDKSISFFLVKFSNDKHLKDVGVTDEELESMSDSVKKTLKQIENGNSKIKSLIEDGRKFFN